MGSFPSLKNNLHQANSPYLQQHAHQSIAWQAWDESLLSLGEQNQKLIIISIGYASCHWCHVMAREAFSNPEVAAFMNDHFINIKVDREERPDLDHTYMLALQLLTDQGGWPLNIVALPNGQPLWGCTYLAEESWLTALQKIIQIQKEQPQSLTQYGAQMQQILNSYSEEQTSKEGNTLSASFASLWQMMDPIHGGFLGGPKFPLPCQLDLWGKIGRYTPSAEKWTQHWLKTLQQIAQGGLFDTLAGGFARYSVNETWNIPHFEKMAYDNGQLLRTYAFAYREKPSAIFKEACEKTVQFIADEWTTTAGAFFSATDADSWDERQQQSTEGAYYTWLPEQINGLNLPEKEAFLAYYGIIPKNLWEGKYILHRPESDEVFCHQRGWSEEFLAQQKQTWHAALLQQRRERKPPSLDRLIVCSWNAILSKGLLCVSRIFQHRQAAQLARKNISFLVNELWESKSDLYRNYGSGGQYTNAFLEDYAWLISLLIDAYQDQWDEDYLGDAHRLLQRTQELFWDEDRQLFQFSPKANKAVFFEPPQTQDDVIPSPNALMCENLYILGHYFEEWDWIEQAENMLHKILPQATQHPRAHGYWLSLALDFKQYKQVYVGGENAHSALVDLQEKFPSAVVWGQLDSEASAPALQAKSSTAELQIFICMGQKCLLPVSTLEAAYTILEKT